DESDEEAVAHTNEVPFSIRSRELAAEHVAIELADAVTKLLGNQDRRMISQNDFSHDLFLPACSVLSFVILQDDGARLQQGLEVGNNLRPAAGYRYDRSEEHTSELQ